MSDVEDRLRELLDEAAPRYLSVSYQAIEPRIASQRRMRTLALVAAAGAAISILAFAVPRMSSAFGPHGRARVLTEATAQATPETRMLTSPVRYRSADYVLSPAPAGARPAVARSDAERVAEATVAASGAALGQLQLVAYGYGTKTTGTVVGPLTRAIAWASITEVGDGRDHVILISAGTPRVIADFVDSPGG